MDQTLEYNHKTYLVIKYILLKRLLPSRMWLRVVW
jgi:hypothetical protein